ISVPLLATSRILPFCAFLCLLLLGCNILVQFEILIIQLSPSTTATASAFSAAGPATSSFSATAAIFAIPDFIPSFPSVTDICFTSDKIRIQVAFGQYFTLTDPYFNADLSIYSQRKHAGIIYIHAERMQGRTTGFNFFRTGNFRTTQTTSYFYLDPFGTHTKRRSNGHFNGSLIVDAV